MLPVGSRPADWPISVDRQLVYNFGGQWSGTLHCHQLRSPGRRFGGSCVHSPGPLYNEGHHPQGLRSYPEAAVRYSPLNVIPYAPTSPLAEPARLHPP